MVGEKGVHDVPSRPSMLSARGRVIAAAVVTAVLVFTAGPASALPIRATLTTIFDPRTKSLESTFSCEGSAPDSFNSCGGTFPYSVVGTSKTDIHALFRWSLDATGLAPISTFALGVATAPRRTVADVLLSFGPGGSGPSSYQATVCDPDGSCRFGNSVVEFPANLLTPTPSGGFPFRLPVGPDTILAASIFLEHHPHIAGEACGPDSESPLFCSTRTWKTSAQLNVFAVPPPGASVVGLEPVPEPGTLILVGTSAGLGWWRWRKRRAAPPAT